jgi:GT2 family glycosyltransferase
MKVCCLIVTYGTRFHLLSKVIGAVIEQEASHLIIVDNGSSIESKEKLDIHIASLPVPTQVISIAQNSGTANAITKGMNEFLNSTAEFLWILDDDNVPEKGALLELIKFWRNKQFSDKEKKLMLASLRPYHSRYTTALLKENPELILPSKNNFCGFHVKDFFYTLSERVFTFRNGKLPAQMKEGRVLAAAYGGLFFHREALSFTNLPNLAFYLYMDDFEFTYSFTNNGGEIWVLPKSIVTDIEQSFYLPEKKKFLYHSSLDGKSDTLIYYAIRNNVYFTSKKRITNKLTYGINKCFFIALITFMAILRGKLKRLKTIFKAINDGINGKLGKSSSYPMY